MPSEQYRLRILIFAFCLWSQVAWSVAPQCINGSPTSNSFIDLFKDLIKSNDPGLIGSPIQQYREFLNATSKNPAESDLYRLRISGHSDQPNKDICISCLLHFPSAFSKKDNTDQLKDIISKVRIPLIRQSCVEAALKRSNGDRAARGFFCASDKAQPKDVGSPGGDGPCINSEIAAYITWITNQAIQCMSTADKPIDPLLFLKKINNESGFSFFQVRINGRSYEGTGLGQLTKIAIDDVNTRGKDLVLTQIQNSPKKSCAVFREALKEKPQTSHDICGLTDINRGLARNIIYSLGIYTIYREITMGPFEKILAKFNLPADVINHRMSSAAVLAYGADGPEGALGELRRASKATLSSTNAFNRFLAKIQYFSNINASFEEIKKINGLEKDSDCLE